MNYLSFNTVFLLLMVALAGAGCATSSQYSARVDNARAQYDQYAQSDYFDKAPKAMQSAQVSLSELDALVSNRASAEKIEHQLYIVESKLALVDARYQTRTAKMAVGSAKEKRQSVMLDVKERDLKAAEREAQLAKQAAASFADQAASAQEELSTMQDRAAELEDKVKALSSRQTARGLVLTLKDILFEFDKAELKAGYNSAIDQLADFLNEYPERSIAIEGFTDSIGSENYNMRLSERRAETVKMALVTSGVASNRIATEGMGEAKPVASNDTNAGRQQNRRVEVILEKPDEITANKSQ